MIKPRKEDGLGRSARLHVTALMSRMKVSPADVAKLGQSEAYSLLCQASCLAFGEAPSKQNTFCWPNQKHSDLRPSDL